MKKLLLLLIILPFLTNAQNWYPIGATWYYNYQEMLEFPAQGYVKYTVIKDTVVDSKASKLINIEVVRYNGNRSVAGSIIVKEDNSKVYCFINNTFKLMYDFTLKVGDTLKLNNNGYACDSVSPLIVDSIRSINISGKNLKVQYVSATYYFKDRWGGRSETITYPITERVGYDNLCVSNNVHFIFNPVCIIDDEFTWNGIRCYKDNDVSYTNCYWDTHYPNAPCDTLIDGSVGIVKHRTNNTNSEFFIYQNPGNSLIVVSYSLIEKSKVKLSVYDVMGRNQLTINNEQLTIGNEGKHTISFDVGELKSGVYFVKLETENGSRVGKFIKN